MTNTTEIQCNCKVHQGSKASVPTGMLDGAQPGSKRYSTVVHNLVGVAYSPLGGLGALAAVQKVAA